MELCNITFELRFFLSWKKLHIYLCCIKLHKKRIYINHILFYRIKHRFSIFNPGFSSRISRFSSRWVNFKKIFSVTRSFSPDISLIFITANARLVRGGQSSFRSFLLNLSKRTIGLEGNQKDETPSFANACWLCCAPLSFVCEGCRFLAPVSFRHSAFSARALEAEKYTGIGESERNRERERKRNK